MVSNQSAAATIAIILIMIIELVLVWILDRWFKFVYNYKAAEAVVNRLSKFEGNQS